MLDEIIALIKANEFEKAKQLLTTIKLDMKNQEDAGTFFCVLGYINAFTKQRNKSYLSDKKYLENVIRIINDNQFSDEFDKSYASCLLKMLG